VRVREEGGGREEDGRRTGGGREEDEAAGGYRTKNKNPTRQCGEKCKNAHMLWRL